MKLKFVMLSVFFLVSSGLAQPLALTGASTPARDILEKPPTRPATHFSRVITLAPVLAEWAAELLGDAETKKTLIAVSEYSLYPHAMKDKPTIGAYFKLNIEKIAALKPDLVIASTIYNRPEQIEQLKRLHLRVELLPAEKFSEMPAWIKNFGKILHEEVNAGQASDRWESEVKALAARKKKSPESVFLEVQHDPLVTIGGNSFLNEALALVGFDNIFKTLTQDYPKVSKESVLAKNPQHVFILDLTGDPQIFAPAVAEWEKFGKHPRILPGDDFARCSFALLQGLRNL